MDYPYICGKTLDDVMRTVIEEVLSHGDRVKPSKGWTTELTGVLLEITNPLSRLSRTETKGKPFSCLGELCWYLAKRKDLEFISYYLSAYKNFADGDDIFGGYGPRLFDWKGLDQMANIKDLLTRNPASRKAVIQLFDRGDIVDEHKDIPCTCTLQFMIRGEKLHMFCNMRSNDVMQGLPHDVFSFTMLQEILARSLSVELGTYKHAVGSLHIYDRTRDNACQFLDEGWQPTDLLMPPMPAGDPWAAISSVLDAESAIRTGISVEPGKVDELNPYWADLIRLLQVFRYSKDKDAKNILKLRGRMSSDIYHTFIDNRIGSLS